MIEFARRLGRKVVDLVSKVKRSLFSTVLFLGFVLLFFLQDLSRVSYHTDERYYIDSGSEVFDLISSGKLLDPAWENEWFLFQRGQVAKFLIGFGLNLYGYHHEDLDYVHHDLNREDFNGEFDWGRFIGQGISNSDVPYSLVQLSPPPKRVLFAARLPIAILASLCVILVFLFTQQAFGTLTAIISSIIMLTDNRWMVLSRRAMMDTPAVFFGLLAFLLATLIMLNCGHRQRRKRKGSLFFLSFLASLSWGSKANGLLTPLVIVVFWVFVVFKNFLQKKQVRIKSLIEPFLFFIATVLFYFILNPSLYRNPVRNFIDSMALNSNSISYHRKTTGLINVKESFIYVIRTATSIDLRTIRKTTPFGAFFLIGFINVAYKLLSDLFHKDQITSLKSLSRDFIVVWFILLVLALSFTTAQPWERYVLPAFPVFYILTSWGIVLGLKFVARELFFDKTAG